MKILVTSFQCESNSRALLHPKKHDFEFFSGEDIFKKLVVKDIFTEKGYEVIPSVYAVALPSATVEFDTYSYYAEKILDTVRANPDLDGVYIFFHGRMEVEGIGSGELYLLKEIKKTETEKVSLYRNSSSLRKKGMLSVYAFWQRGVRLWAGRRRILQVSQE